MRPPHGEVRQADGRRDQAAVDAHAHSPRPLVAKRSRSTGLPVHSPVFATPLHDRPGDHFEAASEAGGDDGVDEDARRVSCRWRSTVSSIDAAVSMANGEGLACWATARAGHANAIAQGERAADCRRSRISHAFTQAGGRAAPGVRAPASSTRAEARLRALRPAQGRTRFRCSAGARRSPPPSRAPDGRRGRW